MVRLARIELAASCSAGKWSTAPLPSLHCSGTLKTARGRVGLAAEMTLYETFFSELTSG